MRVLHFESSARNSPKLLHPLAKHRSPFGGICIEMCAAECLRTMCHQNRHPGRNPALLVILASGPSQLRVITIFHCIAIRRPPQTIARINQNPRQAWRVRVLGTRQSRQLAGLRPGSRRDHQIENLPAYAPPLNFRQLHIGSHIETLAQRPRQPVVALGMVKHRPGFQDHSVPIQNRSADLPKCVAAGSARRRLELRIAHREILCPVIHYTALDPLRGTPPAPTPRFLEHDDPPTGVTQANRSSYTRQPCTDHRRVFRNHGKAMGRQEQLGKSAIAPR